MRISIAAAAVLVLAVASPSGLRAASQPAATTGHSAEVKRLLAAAKEKGERELDFTWSEESFSGAAGAKMFEELFNKMYGTSIQIHFTPGPSMTQMAGKVTQEVAAGRSPSTDILLGTESHYSDLLGRKVLEEYDYTRLSPRIRKDVVAPHGVEIGGIISGILYNTNLVSPSDAPRKLEDALHPKWKGKIASTINAGLFDRVAARPEWGAEKITAFVKRLSQQVAGLIRCGEASRVISGEFHMLVLGCGSLFAHQAKAIGAPLANAILEDGTTIGYFYVGTPRTSTRPNLAKLFVNMVMSEEGQKLAYKTYFSDHPDLPGSQSAAELKDLKAKGKEALKVNVKFVTEHPELHKLGNELIKILREKQGG